MRRNRFLDNERRLAAARSITYRGTASVEINALNFNNELKEVDGKTVQRFKQFFHDENGCRRLDPRYHVSVLIEQHDLDQALQSSGIPADDLLKGFSDKYPTLNFPVGLQLECLDGHDLLQAGAESLPPGDKRWTVDLYLAGQIP